MATRNYISSKQIKHCDKCGKAITFAKNRFGKWFAVDAIYDPHKAGNTSYYYESGIGAHGNLTPHHKCPSTHPECFPISPNDVSAETIDFNKKMFALLDAGKVDELKELMAAYSQQNNQ